MNFCGEQLAAIVGIMIIVHHATIIIDTEIADKNLIYGFFLLTRRFPDCVLYQY